MFDQILQKLFIESRITLEFLFYEIVALSFEFSIHQKKGNENVKLFVQRQRIYCNFCRSSIKIIL